jgi:hypothetical protein
MERRERYRCGQTGYSKADSLQVDRSGSMEGKESVSIFAEIA